MNQQTRKALRGLNEMSKQRAKAREEETKARLAVIGKTLEERGLARERHRELNVGETWYSRVAPTGEKLRVVLNLGDEHVAIYAFTREMGSLKWQVIVPLAVPQIIINSILNGSLAEA